MYSNLPGEVLEQIFTCPDITKKDLLELQLTCKQWSLVAQRHFYDTIDLEDAALYGSKARDRSRMKERVSRWTQALLFLDVQFRNRVKVIKASFIPENGMVDLNTRMPEELGWSLATLAGLCPNLSALEGETLPAVFYHAISNLHVGGALQKLEYLGAPAAMLSDRETLVPGYHKAIFEFKDTLKEITAFDVASRIIAANNLMQPDSLQHFPRVEHLHLHEISRIHLSRLQDYISNSCPNAKRLSIFMGMTEDESLPVYQNVSSSTPNNKVQELSMTLGTHPLSPNEMIYAMRAFPVLNCLFFESGPNQHGLFDPIQHDLKVVKQFLDYLFRIPRVDYKYMWFGVSEGLGFLPHVAKSIDIQHLSIALHDGVAPDGLSIQLDREVEKTNGTIKTKYSSLTIEARPHDTRAFFLGALEPFKDKPIDKLTFGQDDNYYFEVSQVDEESLDYLINNFASLQELAYRSISFPWIAAHSRTSKAKSLRCLDLHYCILSEDYFTKLSSQIERVDYLKYSTDEVQLDRYMPTLIGKKIRITMPYTEIHTAELAIDLWVHYTIRILTKDGCYVLKYCSDSDGSRTLEACISSEALPNDTHEIVIQCLTLKKVCIGSLSFELSASFSEQ